MLEKDSGEPAQGKMLNAPGLALTPRIQGGRPGGGKGLMVPGELSEFYTLENGVCTA